MLPSPRRALVVVAIALVALVAGCTDDPSGQTKGGLGGATDETLVPPEATLPGGRVTGTFVAERLVAAVTTRLGLAFPEEADRCAIDALEALLTDADIAEFREVGVIGELPEPLPTRILSAFDGCISDDLVGEIGASILVNSGASGAESRCFYRLQRERLGIGGMYRYAARVDGEFDIVDPNLQAIVDTVLRDCGLDPTQLVVATAPAPTNPPTPPTTSDGIVPLPEPVTAPTQATTTTRPAPVTLDQVSVPTAAPPPTLRPAVPVQTTSVSSIPSSSSSSPPVTQVGDSPAGSVAAP